MNLNKLLKPTSVAVIGASEKEGFGGDVCRNILSYVEDRSHVYFIHPKRDSVFGVPCYKSISDVPENVDLMVICTSQKTVIPLLQEGAKKGVGGAVVFASGYGEVGTAEGKQNEAELIAAAKELDIAVMGPNCAGFVNYIDNVQAFAFISAKRDRKGSVGVVSQSGQLCLSMMDDPGMRFSYNISAGNGKEILIQIADQNEFLELKKDYGNDMTIGFIRLDGETIGCIANKEERISAQGAKKAASFVKLCDAFGIGILTVTDTVGFVAEIEQEKELSQAIGAMTGAFVQATVPKVNVISKKAFGSAYVSMNSKSIGADFVYAWSDAKIGMMEADMAVKIMYPGANADVLKEKAKEYEELQSDVYTAARRGYVDTVIDPAETRKYVIGAFEMLYTKREMQIPKKHSVF